MEMARRWEVLHLVSRANDKIEEIFKEQGQNDWLEEKKQAIRLLDQSGYNRIKHGLSLRVWKNRSIIGWKVQAPGNKAICDFFIKLETATLISGN